MNPDVKNPRTMFVACIDNSDYPAALELRKVYVRLEDTGARRHGYIRVINQSGEDYLFPAALFLPVMISDGDSTA